MADPGLMKFVMALMGLPILFSNQTLHATRHIFTSNDDHHLGMDLYNHGEVER
jgi:hypothetical protein